MVSMCDLKTAVKMKSKFNWPFVLIISISVSIFSCQPEKKTEEPRGSKGGRSVGGSFSLAVSSIPGSFSPSDINSSEQAFILSQVHSGLVRYLADGESVAPALAESWEIDEAGKTIVFHIRPGVKFHDSDCFENGTREIIADDFVNSFEKLCAPTSKSGAYEASFRGNVVGAKEFHEGKAERISGVKAWDDYRLSIELSGSLEPFIYILAEPYCAVVATECKDQDVGAGPFSFSVVDGVLELTRNAAYPITDEFGNSLPYLDGASLKVVDTKENELEAFFNGELDVVSGVYPDPVRKILDQHISEFSGADAEYIMVQSGNLASQEVYTIYRKGLKGITPNFLNRIDLSNVQYDKD